MSVYFGGNLCYAQWLSAVYDPFPKFKSWLECLSGNGGNMLSEFCCDYEGAYCRIIYESLGEKAWSDMQDTGILYITDTGQEQTVCAYCDKRQLVRAFYLAMQRWHRISNAQIIAWIDEDAGGRWGYYNRQMRSTKVEYYITGHDCLWNDRFEQTIIGERLHMWAEFGDALFWAEPRGCCGNADRVHTDTHGDISAYRSFCRLKTL